MVLQGKRSVKEFAITILIVMLLAGLVIGLTQVFIKTDETNIIVTAPRTWIEDLLEASIATPTPTP
jgi:uncharacterized Tic20 family protein